MKVAVTGASGYIGGWLLRSLHARGHEIHAQDLTATAGEVYCASFWTGDLGMQPERISWLQERQPDVVIHLAALYGRVWGERDMVKTAGSNAGLTAELARDCARTGARLMFMSSSEVYGRTANWGTVFPRSALQPINMYGLSKKWGEEAAQLYAPDGLMITRLNMPYGPAYWPPLRGEVPGTSGRPGLVGYNVLHSMLWQAGHGLDLRVHRGTERCLTWVGDTVRGLAMIMEAGQPGTWNVNRNDDHVPVAELAHRVVDLTGSSSRIIEEDPPEGITLRKSLDSQDLLALDWKPEVSLDDGMKRSWDYFRQFGPEGEWQGQ